MKKLLLSLALFLPFLAVAQQAVNFDFTPKSGNPCKLPTAYSDSKSTFTSGDITLGYVKQVMKGSYGSTNNNSYMQLKKSVGQFSVESTNSDKIITRVTVTAPTVTNPNSNSALTMSITAEGVQDFKGESTNISTKGSTYTFDVPESYQLKGNVLTFDAGTGATIIASLEVTYKDAPVGPQAPVLAFEPATVELKENDSVLLSDVTTLSGVPEGAEVTYTSADEGIAGIVDGELMAMGEGATTITATTSATADYLEGTAELKVVVKSNKQDPQLSFAQNEVNVFVGDEEFVGLTASCAEGVKVVYSSDNEDVAMVDENDGFVIIVAAGTATITATFVADDTYYSATASYVINVNKHDAELSFNETAVEKYFNSTEYGEFPVLNNPNNLVVAYASSKPEVATVEDGVVTILADGTTTITATSAATDAYNAGEASYTLTVTDASISSKYVLVKDIAQIENGSKVLIVNTEAGKTLSNVPKENNFDAVDIKIEGEEVVTLSDEVAILEVEAVDNKYAFKVTNYSDGEKVNVYLASTTTATKNYLKHIKEQTLASVSILETNDAEIKFSLNPNGRNTIQFNPNNNSPLFSCYTGGQNPVQLYVQSGAQVVAPVIDHIITYRFEDGRFEINFDVDNEEAAIYYNIQKADAPARVIAADGKDYIRHDGNTFIVDDGDTVSYYAEHKGVKSEIKTVLANTTTTGIEAIEAEGEGAARYFNLQGVEVAQPAAGQVYIMVVNGVATKVVK